MPPPVVALIVALAMWGETHFARPLVGASPLLAALAVLCIVGGIGTVGLGFRSFFRAKTTIDPVHVERASALVTSGIYAVTRNPMYVGLSAVLAGWMLCLADPWVIAGPVFVVLYITRFQIIPEERLLVARFGADFEAYCTRVRRWL